MIESFADLSSAILFQICILNIEEVHIPLCLSFGDEGADNFYITS